MGPSPWTFHAACLRGGIIKAPAGPHEILLIMRDALDLLGPGPGQVLRLAPGAVLHVEFDAAADSRLAVHLDGTCASSGFRFALGLMLGLDGASDQNEVQINEWIDAHVAVVLLPVTCRDHRAPPRPRYDGLLNGFAEGHRHRP